MQSISAYPGSGLSPSSIDLFPTESFPTESFPTTLSIPWVSRENDRLRKYLGSLPPSGAILISCFIVQVGTALAKSMFDTLGALGTVFICKAIAALFLWIMYRPKLKDHGLKDYGLVIALGVALALMNLAFYSAIARIPLGVSATLEFLGPLGVSVLGSRKPSDLVWVALAGSGVFLLAPMVGSNLDPVGLAFTGLSAIGWAAYILLSVPVGKVFAGNSGLALSMTVASFILAIPGIHQGGTGFLHPQIWAIAILVAVLSTVLPYSIEFSALKRISSRVFGILMSIEPAIAALVGFLFLHEALEFRTIAAVLLVTSAAIGVTATGDSQSPH
jgi:inner membrane transporter RhtA